MTSGEALNSLKPSLIGTTLNTNGGLLIKAESTDSINCMEIEIEIPLER